MARFNRADALNAEPDDGSGSLGKIEPPKQAALPVDGALPPSLEAEAASSDAAGFKKRKLAFDEAKIQSELQASGSIWNPALGLVRKNEVGDLHSLIAAPGGGTYFWRDSSNAERIDPNIRDHDGKIKDGWYVLGADGTFKPAPTDNPLRGHEAKIVRDPSSGKPTMEVNGLYWRSKGVTGHDTEPGFYDKTGKRVKGRELEIKGKVEVWIERHPLGAGAMGLGALAGFVVGLVMLVRWLRSSAWVGRFVGRWREWPRGARGLGLALGALGGLLLVPAIRGWLVGWLEAHRWPTGPVDAGLREALWLGLLGAITFAAGAAGSRLLRRWPRFEGPLRAGLWVGLGMAFLGMVAARMVEVDWPSERIVQGSVLGLAGLLLLVQARNLAGGLSIAFRRLFAPGDRIQAGQDGEGEVLACGLTATRIRRPDGAVGWIPNARFLLGSFTVVSRTPVVPTQENPSAEPLDEPTPVPKEVAGTPALTLGRPVLPPEAPMPGPTPVQEPGPGGPVWPFYLLGFFGGVVAVPILLGVRVHPKRGAACAGGALLALILAGAQAFQQWLMTDQGPGIARWVLAGLFAAAILALFWKNRKGVSIA